MSDEAHSLRTIDWRSVFPFTQLFRAFRIAIHPAKMALALLAILLVYTVGRAMDGLWLDRYQAVPGEVSLYENASSRASFSREVDASRTVLADRRAAMARQLSAESKAMDANRPPLPDDASYRQMKRVITERRDRDVDAARESYDKAGEKTDALADQRDNQIRAAYARAGSELQTLRDSTGRGLCLTFVNYEATQIDSAARAVIAFDWMGPQGVLASLHRFIFTGPGWALSKHPLYFSIFTVIALLVWSVIGGAIARIAAVHVSQDEKISVRQAIRFSTNKLMSFFAAPVMPLILIGLIALILATLGVLTEIPYLGGLVTIIISALFFVLIGVGILIACALIGWVVGFGLMYPTIAVEGSDAFDAVSRSFSYVFARPWKMFIYSVIAIIYGAVTYLFLRFMVFLTLSVVHECLTFWTHSVGPAGRTSIANAWTGPADLFDLSTGPRDPFSLTAAESLGSGLIMFWVMLFVALLGAYLLSFFISVNTIMYYLLRHEVDATDIDDVYLEPSEDEFEDALPENATGTAPTRSEPASVVPASSMTERAVGTAANSASASGSSPHSMPTPLTNASAGPMATTPMPHTSPDADVTNPPPPATPVTDLPPTPPPAGS